MSVRRRPEHPRAAGPSGGRITGSCDGRPLIRRRSDCFAWRDRRLLDRV